MWVWIIGALIVLSLGCDFLVWCCCVISSRCSRVEEAFSRENG